MSQAMMEMVRQHRECDDQLNRCEAALQKGDMPSAGRNFRLFSEQLDSHFALEENKLFPAFEAATGMTAGPTVVMRGEHAEIRALRDEAYANIEANQPQQALAAIDTLNVLIQQHNIKEENVLYPMCGGSVPQLMSVLGFGGAAGGGGCGGACSCGSAAKKEVA